MSARERDPIPSVVIPNEGKDVDGVNERWGRKVTKLFGYRRRVVFVHPCGASVMRDRAEIPHVFPEEVVDVDG